jgi:hypothetical protein
MNLGFFIVRPRTYQATLVCPKYFNLLIMAKVSIDCFGIIWLVTDAFILLNVHGIISLSYLLSSAPIQHCWKDCCLQ